MAIDHDEHGGEDDKHGNPEPKQPRSRSQRARAALKKGASSSVSIGRSFARGVGKTMKTAKLAGKVGTNPRQWAGKIHNARNRLKRVNEFLSKKPPHFISKAKREMEAAQTALNLKF